LQTSATSNVGSTQEAQTNGPFWKTAFVLWILALCGVFLVLPYAATLENKALAVAAARTHLNVWELLAISVVQTAILLAIAVILGQWAARKLRLGTPLIAALLTGRSKPKRSLWTLLVAFALGIATALALLMLDHWVFVPIPAVAELIHNTESDSPSPTQRAVMSQVSGIPRGHTGPDASGDGAALGVHLIPSISSALNAPCRSKASASRRMRACAHALRTKRCAAPCRNRRYSRQFSIHQPWFRTLQFGSFQKDRDVVAANSGSIHAKPADSGEQRAGTQTVPQMYVHCLFVSLIVFAGHVSVCAPKVTFSHVAPS
jgi:hypothetical protein